MGFIVEIFPLIIAPSSRSKFSAIAICCQGGINFA